MTPRVILALEAIPFGVILLLLAPYLWPLDRAPTSGMSDIHHYHAPMAQLLAAGLRRAGTRPAGDARRLERDALRLGPPARVQSRFASPGGFAPRSEASASPSDASFSKSPLRERTSASVSSMPRDRASSRAARAE